MKALPNAPKTSTTNAPSAAPTITPARTTRPSSPFLAPRRYARPRGLPFLLNLFATLQIVWFYLARVPSALNLQAFAQGRERIPFQQRVLLMAPLRWAHSQPTLKVLAARLSHTPGWFPQLIHPEALVQAAIDLVSIAITGLVVRSIYRTASPFAAARSSQAALLLPFAFPLTLLMIAVTTCFQTIHSLRFVYDLPAIAFFSIGLWLIYFRCSPLLFALLFIPATLNRETTLFLLPLYACAQCISTKTLPQQALRTQLHAQAAPNWRRLYAPATLAVIVPLAAFWLAWHQWITRHFAHNPSAADPRFLLNLGILACPLAWPQLLSAGAWLWPLVLLYRRPHHRWVADPFLRLATWLVPAWFVCMLHYGLFIEPRIFGELIPLFACSTLLIAEDFLAGQIPLSPERLADAFGRL